MNRKRIEIKMTENKLDTSKSTSFIITEENSADHEVFFLVSFCLMIYFLIWFKIKQQIKQSLPCLKPISIHSDRLNLDFTVYVQEEEEMNQQRCTIMTVHDLGCDRKS